MNTATAVARPRDAGRVSAFSESRVRDMTLSAVRPPMTPVSLVHLVRSARRSRNPARSSKQETRRTRECRAPYGDDADEEGDRPSPGGATGGSLPPICAADDASPGFAPIQPLQIDAIRYILQNGVTHSLGRNGFGQNGRHFPPDPFRDCSPSRRVDAGDAHRTAQGALGRTTDTPFR